MRKRLRWIAIAIGTALLAIFTPVDEIILIAAVSTVLYRFVRRKVNERYSQASGVSRTDTNRR